MLNDRYCALFTKINCNDSIDENILREYEQVKSDLDTFERDKARGIILRSKVKWVEEGEKIHRIS